MPKYNSYTQFTPRDGAEYNCTITEAVYEPDGKYGPEIRVKFEITDPVTKESMEIMQWVQTQISDRYPLFSDLIDLTYGQHQEEGDFEADDMVGMEGVATVALVAGKGDKADQKFAKVVSIVPKDAAKK